MTEGSQTRSGTDADRKIVLIADPIHSAGIERLKGRFDLAMPGEEIGEEARRRVVAAVVRTFETGDEWMARLPGLKLIAKHGSGIDNIDVASATRRGILVANTPGGANSTAVAEGAVTLMLSVLRRVREMDAFVREGRFDKRWSLELGDLTGATLALIGFGQIAKVVARICGAGFQMRVTAYDPYVSAEDMAAHGVEKAETLEAALRSADVISVHTPLSDKTRHLIGAPEIAVMKPTAILVNTSRGGLVDEAALAEALGRGAILGAGIDVFEKEPPPVDHPLMRFPGVVLSPHVAGVTNGSMKGMALAVCDVIDVALAGKRPATLINPEALGEK